MPSKQLLFHLPIVRVDAPLHLVEDQRTAQIWAARCVPDVDLNLNVTPKKGLQLRTLQSKRLGIIQRFLALDYSGLATKEDNPS